MKISDYSAPLMATWQLTHDCDLACLHCCTLSAPGRKMPGELSREEALSLADRLAQAQIPYVMLCGGEPTLVPHFLDTAERLGRGGCWLKIETNGRNLAQESAARLSKLPIRSVQISLDGATEESYGKMRPGASLEKALGACLLVRAYNMPLEITFAPAAFNIREAERVIDIALSLGAFRLNTGKLMAVGRARLLWKKLCPSDESYAEFRAMLDRRREELEGRIELCYEPFSLEEDLAVRAAEPPGTLFILPDGRVALSGGMSHAVADLRTQSVPEAWASYQKAWLHSRVRADVDRVAREGVFRSDPVRSHAWVPLSNDFPAGTPSGKETA
jgi:MoaA/NifB/PqqE/SkfB family radical SAM enzyme